MQTLEVDFLLLLSQTNALEAIFILKFLAFDIALYYIKRLPEAM